MPQDSITTAGRRIVRELNSRPQHYWCYFDKDGRVVAAVYGQNVDRSGVTGYVHDFPSRPDSFGHRWTQRVVQRHLDADNACAAIGRSELAGLLSDEWQYAEENERPRCSAAEFAKSWDDTMREIEAKV